MTRAINDNNRIQWLDLARVFAILCAVMCHSVWGVYSFELDFMSAVSIPSRVFAFLIFAIARAGVPFFLMISGFLLLDREYSGNKIKHFWLHNVLHLLICTEIWIVIYNIFLYLHDGRAIEAVPLIKEMFFIGSFSMSHIWYMPMILGLYVLIPFVANGLRMIHEKFVIVPLAIFYLICFVYPFLNIVLNAVGRSGLNVQVSAGFSGGVYGIYLVFGYLVKKGYFRSVNSLWLTVFFLCSIVITTVFHLWVYDHNYRYNTWYDNPFLLIASVSLFELFSRIKKVLAFPAVKWLAAYSFAVYLTFNIFQRLLTNLFCYKLSLSMPLRSILFWLAITAAGYVSSLLIGLIPKIGKYILYLK